MNALLRAEDVARRLGVTPMTVYNLGRSGVLRTVTFRASGKRMTYRWREIDVETFIERHLQESKPEVVR